MSQDKPNHRLTLNMRWRTLVGYRQTWLVGLLCLALALVLSFSLLRHGRSQLIGADYEGGLSFWTTWWPWHALSGNYDLVFNNYTLFPVYTNLLPVLSLPTSVVYYVLRPLLGPLLTFNLLLPLYLALSAWWAFAFLKKQGITLPLALIGGLFFAFNPVTYRLAGEGAPALLGLFVFPLWMLTWDYFLTAPNLRRALGLVAVSYLLTLMSLQFWNLALTTLLPYAVYRVYHKRLSPEAIDNLLIGSLVFSLLFLLYPASPLLWSTYSPHYKSFEVWQGVEALADAGWTIGGWAILFALITLAALWVPWEISPTRRLWGFVALYNLACYVREDFGPLSLVDAIFDVPRLPNLTAAPLYLLPVILAASVVLMQGAAFWRGKIKSPRLAQVGLIGALTVWLALSGWAGQLPASSLPDRPLYAAWAGDPEDYVIIDVPLSYDSLAYGKLASLPNTQAEYARTSFYKIAGRTLAYIPWHHKRVVGGLTGTLRPDELTAYNENLLLKLLSFQPIEQDPHTIAVTIRNEVQRWRVGYITLNRDELPLDFVISLGQWFAWTHTFCYLGLDGGNLEIWRSTWHPAGCPAYQVDLGSPYDALAIGDGWFFPETWPGETVRWAGGSLESTLTLWATPSSDYRLNIRARSPNAAGQTVEILAGEHVVGQITLGEEWQVYTVIVRRADIQEGGLLPITLRHAGLQPVEGRDLAAVYDYLMLEPVGN